MKSVFASILLFLVTLSAALAVEPDEVLEDPALEERARNIDRQLRCVVCQSQSIDDSNAPLAKDLRLVVRERLTAGDSDEEVIAYVADRYGDYVLLKPRLAPTTIILWLFPAFAVVVGAALAFFYLRGVRKAEAPEPLTEEEERALHQLIDERRE